MRFIHPAKYVIAAILAVAFLSSCDTSKYLAGEELLLRGNNIKLNDKGNLNRKRALKYELSLLYKQKPNSRFFFIPREWFYHKSASKAESSKYHRWQKRVLGEPPAIYSKELTTATEKSMTVFLWHKGYYNAEVYYTEFVNPRKKKKISITYHVTPNQQFQIGEVSYFSKDTAINRILGEIRRESVLKPGAGVEDKLYDRERDRIVGYLRNHGYAYFSASSIAPLEADTLIKPKTAEIFFEVLPPPDDSIHRAYHVGDITVFMDYTPGQADSLQYDSLFNGVHFLSPRSSFRIRPEAIMEALFLKKGELYSQRNYDQTNRQLSALGIFRFVRIRQEINPDDPSQLDFRIELTQSKKIELGLNVGFNYASRSASGAGNLIGFSASPSFRNRNVFKGAELLITDLSAGVEVNPAPDAIADGRFWNTVDVRLQTDLYLPRFVDNLGIWRTLNKVRAGKHKLIVSDNFYQSLKDNAVTRFSASYNYLLILDFYEYNLFNGSLGYDFQRSSSQRIILNHIGIDYLAPITKPRFDTLLGVNDFLARSFGDQLFVSLLFRDVNFVYNSRPDRRGSSHYLGLYLELAGAELWAGNALYNAFAQNPDTLSVRIGENKTVSFSQYARTRLDLRTYRQYTPKSSIAARFALGIARPFGFTSDVPYVKQFFVGGPNSIRAWAPRGLGPGAYEDPLSFDRRNNTRLFQTGDFSLEGSLEYRFNIFWMVNGALFLDAGNIWTLQQDTSRCGSQFLLRGRQYQCIDESGTPVTYVNEPFYRQIAIGGGFGLRFDFSFFILRLDMGLKLRHARPIPLEEGRSNFRNYWFRDFRPDGGRTGLKAGDVINFNLGFGYPF